MEGTLDIKLVTEQRIQDSTGAVKLVEIDPDDKGKENMLYNSLFPLVGSAQYNGTNFDKYGMPTADGYVDQIVRVKNIGTAPAYVRVIVAVPAALDDTNDAGHNALHWNLGNRFMPDGSFSAEHLVNEVFTRSSSTDTEYVSWEFSETAIVDGVKCNLYIFTYSAPLADGEMTDAAAFVGFYLDRHVDIENGHIMLDGVDTGFMKDTVKIHVKAQAVQSYEMGSVEEAFDKAELSDNPWAEQN